MPKSWYKNWDDLPWQKQVIKSGCETNLTIGELRELPIILKNNGVNKEGIYSFPTFIAKNFLEIHPLKQATFADKGDSGSVVWDLEGRAVGLLHCVMQTSVKPIGIATPIYAVLESLNIDLILQ